MVWLNTQCINEKVPPGTLGGSMCICPKCKEHRDKMEGLETIKHQMTKVGNELDILVAMMDRWPEKQKELRGASDMMVDWKAHITEK